MFKKERIIIYTIFIISVAVIFSILINLPNFVSVKLTDINIIRQNSKGIIKSVEEDCLKNFKNSDEIGAQKCQSSEFTRLANENKDESLCDNIINQKDKEECFDLFNSRMALNAKEPKPEYCNKINNNEQKTGCLDTVYYYMAKLNTGEAFNLCNKITDIKLKEDCNKNFVK